MRLEIAAQFPKPKNCGVVWTRIYALPQKVTAICGQIAVVWTPPLYDFDMFTFMNASALLKRYIFVDT